jgi:hypothetical protein
MECKVIDDRTVDDVTATVEIDADGSVHDAQSQTQSVQSQTANRIYDEVTGFLASLPREANVTSLLEMSEEAMKEYMTHIDVQATRTLLAAHSYAHELERDTESANERKGAMDASAVKRGNARFLAMFRAKCRRTFRALFRRWRIYSARRLRICRRTSKCYSATIARARSRLRSTASHWEAKFVDALNAVMRDFEGDGFQNHRLIAKLLATPFTVFVHSLFFCHSQNIMSVDG